MKKFFGFIFFISQITVAAETMVSVPTGHYVPFFFSKDSKKIIKPVQIDSFLIDRYPVTKAKFLAFVRENPKWRKSLVTRLFADAHYLEDWNGDLSFSQGKNTPAINVSWFAATAFCESYNKELPTTDQWEYAAVDNERESSETKKRILAWYEKPNSKKLSSVGNTPRNRFGIYDLYGLVWEWTLDFNSAMIGDDSRDGGSSDGNLFCGNGSQGASDSTDYASFMRYSFRSSLKANYAVRNLGFRCAKGKAR